MNSLKLWIRAVRPFSFSISSTSVLLGTVLASKAGSFDLNLFMLTLLGVLLLHSGTNFISDYYDYLVGVDTKDSFGSSGVLVEELLQPEQVRRGGIICFLLALPIAIYLTYLKGLVIAILMLFGALGGYFYTASPINYKYHALGVPLVFLILGPTIVIGSYFVQTGTYNHQILLVSIPFGLLISAILHSNDVRDIKHDSRVGVKTLSIILGKKLAGYFYLILIMLAYFFIIQLVWQKIVTPWVLITLSTLPYAIKNITVVRNMNSNIDQNIEVIDIKTAQLHFKVGILFILAIIGSKFIG